MKLPEKEKNKGYVIINSYRYKIVCYQTIEQIEEIYIFVILEYMKYYKIQFRKRHLQNGYMTLKLGFRWLHRRPYGKYLDVREGKFGKPN